MRGVYVRVIASLLVEIGEADVDCLRRPGA